MGAVVPHRGFRLAFHTKNIHTAAMILLLLIGMLAGKDSVKTDAEMDEVWKLVPEGIPIEIRA
jgi:hypothetical protein